MSRVVKILTIMLLLVTIAEGLSYSYAYFLKKAYPTHYEEYIQEFSHKYGVEEALVLAIIKCESGFENEAVSRAGAVGLMQIMPATFEWLQTHVGDGTLEKEQLIDPRTNIEYGAYFLSILMERYASDVAIISAYNAGPGNIDRWLRDERYSEDGRILKEIPYQETRAYVEKVLRSREIYRELYFKKGKEAKKEQKRWQLLDLMRG